MGLTVNDFLRFARLSFEMSPVPAAPLVLQAQARIPPGLAERPLNLESAHEAAQHETDYVLAHRPLDTAGLNQSDKLALLASLGGGFSLRNMAARSLGSLLPDAYVGKDAREQTILDMHRRNLNELSNF